MRLKTGKLDSDVLQSAILDKIVYKRPEVRVGAGIGEDCAVISFGDYDCVVSTDPITASVADAGRLSIFISCNDIASNGVEPLAVMLTILLPAGTTSEEAGQIMSQAAGAAEKVGVQIAGGHTEVTDTVNRPVIVSTAFGRAKAGRSQTAADMRAGHRLLLTKCAGLEGTGIICRERADELMAVLTGKELERGIAMLDSVSVIDEGVTAGHIGTSGMHDVTEGGVLGAVWEMCRVGGLGAEVTEKDIPVDDVTLKVAEHFGIDWMRLISSGCMLIAADDEHAERIKAALSERSIRCTQIGKVCEREYGVMLKRADGSRMEIAPPGADELYKVIGR